MLRQPFYGDYPVTLGFGETYEGLYTARNPHRGIDYGLPEGTPVLSADDGHVIFAGWDKTGYGQFVMIAHDNGIVTGYAHLSKPEVVAGQDVTKGQVIGISGSSGNSTGAHLHFEVRDQTLGRAVDPFPLMQNVYDDVKWGTVTAGKAHISCQCANMRDGNWKVTGTIYEGVSVEVLDSEPVEMYGVPYRKVRLELYIAEHDTFGNQILESDKSVVE